MNLECITGGAVPLEARVQSVVIAINSGTVIPFGDYGTDQLYYFQTMDNALGNIIYTVFDRETNLGLASYMVRYGAASTIRQILFQPFPRSQIDLQYLILPAIVPLPETNGTVYPEPDLSVSAVTNNM